MENTHDPSVNVLGIAKAQKGVIWCVVASIVLWIGAALFGRTVQLVYLVLFVAELYFVYKLVKALKGELVFLWMIGMIVPLLNIILLLVLSHRASTAIRAEEFKVGLMGADVQEIAAKHPASSQ